MMKPVAVYAATFDPPTNGHAWMIREGIRLFRRLIVAVAINPDKKNMFDQKERTDMLAKIASNAIFEVATQEGIPVSALDSEYGVEIDTIGKELLVDYASHRGMKYLLRGIRNGADFGYEQQMRHVNRDRNPLVETVFLISPPELTQVSSSTVKGLIGFAGWQDLVRQYVPPAVMAAIEQKQK